MSGNITICYTKQALKSALQICRSSAQAALSWQKREITRRMRTGYFASIVTLAIFVLPPMYSMIHYLHYLYCFSGLGALFTLRSGSTFASFVYTFPRGTTNREPANIGCDRRLEIATTTCYVILRANCVLPSERWWMTQIVNREKIAKFGYSRLLAIVIETQLRH